MQATGTSPYTTAFDSRLTLSRLTPSRLTTFHSSRKMSLSDAIDRRYRMMPGDLAGKPRQVIVRGVSVEGLEFVTPLVYFEGVGRPLALDPQQRIEMTSIARSTILADWIGSALVLEPVKDGGRERIRLRSTSEKGGAPPIAPSPLPAEGETAKKASMGKILLRTLIVVVIVSLLLTIVWQVENGGLLESLNLDALFNVVQPWF